jgi:hypothetical protein
LASLKPESKNSPSNSSIILITIRYWKKCNQVLEAKRKRLEAFVQETRVSETVAKTIAQVQQRQKEDSKPLYRQITETFEPTPESIWEDIIQAFLAHGRSCGMGRTVG